MPRSRSKSRSRTRTKSRSRTRARTRTKSRSRSRPKTRTYRSYSKKSYPKRSYGKSRFSQCRTPIKSVCQSRPKCRWDYTNNHCMGIGKLAWQNRNASFLNRGSLHNYSAPKINTGLVAQRIKQLEDQTLRSGKWLSGQYL